LYTAKGAASFLVPAASWMQVHYGSWHGVFVTAAIANIAVAATALLLVKPMRISRLQRTASLASHAAAK
jgi:MFS transporter, OFA family, oxalate/formate antiporter